MTGFGDPKGYLSFRIVEGMADHRCQDSGKIGNWHQLTLSRKARMYSEGVALLNFLNAVMEEFRLLNPLSSARPSMEYF